jgi:drug/metabolite transporter (DMT)-like permease
MPQFNAGTRAALLMASASLLLSLVPVFVKAIPRDSGIPLEEIILARASVSLLITWIIVMKRKVTLRPVRPLLILLRCAVGTFGMVLYFSAVRDLDLAGAVTLNRLSPFFVLLFAFIFLGEKLYRLQILAMAIAFGGAAFVLQPGRLPVTTAGVLALLSAVAAGGAYTTLRALAKYDSPLRIVFWFSAFMTLLFLPGTIAKGVVPGLRDLITLLGIGVAGAGGQLLMTAAYRYAPGGEVAIYGYLSVVYAAVWQPLFFGVEPGSAVITGGSLVLLGGALNYMAGTRLPGIRRFVSGVPGFGGIFTGRNSGRKAASSREADHQPQPPPE